MKNHDLTLPAWGPYNKNYLGASHIADKEKGLRFDLNLFPGFYRRSVMLTKDIADSGAKMTASSADVSHYAYRYQLLGAEEIYVDADFCSENGVLTVKCSFVNNTDNPESLTLNAVMSMHPASLYRNDIRSVSVRPLGDAFYIESADYSHIRLGQAVAYDGLCLGEARRSGFTGGSVLASGLFGKEGDSVTYTFKETRTDSLIIRYSGGGSVTVKVGERRLDVQLPERKEVGNERIPIEEAVFSEITLLPHNARIELDGILIGGDAEFYTDSDVFIPRVSGDSRAFSLEFSDYVYGVTSDAEHSVLRRLHADDCGMLLLNSIHDHVSLSLGRGGDEYVDLFIRPIFVSAHSKKEITLTVCAKADAFPCDHTLYEPKCNPEGEKYLLSQKIMSAVTLTNVVFPVYCRRSYIRHNTPGRFWDSLYTWDSGFIGMGLLGMSKKRAEECLNAYLTDVGDIHSPYIFHGTPLPTQILLYSELYSKTGDTELIKRLYPSVRQQYRYFADMRKHKDTGGTGIFSLWEVFYNSGGWDDYPTQKYVHDHKLEKEVSPLANTAFTVLCGKILQGIAEEIGEDASEYSEDITFYSDALNKYAWDEDSGYYGYVCHKGEPSVLKIDGVNANMGMDGVYPYIASVSDGEQSRRITENIKNGMFTAAGVSCVDLRAPYYREDGYWNGSVWLPHQWILWKALLDHGELSLALDIAERALEIWQKEASLTYNCYEHFMIKNCRGAGFHQFSGLSTPALMWFSALYTPFTVTVGHLGTVRDVRHDGKTFSFKLHLYGERPTALVCLPEGGEYGINTSGEVKKINGGTYALIFGGGAEETVTVTEKQSGR